MSLGTILQAELMNHGQSEIWLRVDGKDCPARTLATNELVNVTRRLCAPDVFDTFYKECHLSVGHVAALRTGNLDEIAAELNLEH